MKKPAPMAAAFFRKLRRPLFFDDCMRFVIGLQQKALQRQFRKKRRYSA
jgi:hypothetical protein